MTSVRQLYALQELDLVLDQLRNRQQVAEEELQTEVSIGVLERALESETERITEVQLQQRHNQLEFESHRERSQVLETWLYDGSITNARDLENIQQESVNVGRMLAQEEAALLDLSIQAEESQTKCADLDRRLTETRAQWEGRRDELQQILQELAGQLGGYEGPASEGGRRRRPCLFATLRNAAPVQEWGGCREGGPGAVPRLPDGPAYPIESESTQRPPTSNLH